MTLSKKERLIRRELSAIRPLLEIESSAFPHDVRKALDYIHAQVFNVELEAFTHFGARLDASIEFLDPSQRVHRSSVYLFHPFLGQVVFSELHEVFYDARVLFQRLTGRQELRNDNRRARQ